MRLSPVLLLTLGACVGPPAEGVRIGPWYDACPGKPVPCPKDPSGEEFDYTAYVRKCKKAAEDLSIPDKDAWVLCELGWEHGHLQGYEQRSSGAGLPPLPNNFLEVPDDYVVRPGDTIRITVKDGTSYIWAKEVVVVPEAFYGVIP